MSDTKSIWSYEDIQAVQLAASQQLETFGLAIPRGEPEVACKEGSLKCKFGLPLSKQQTYPYEWAPTQTFHLPRIFVVLVDFLEGHVFEKGLFRIAGSISRQKSLRSALECRTPSLPPDSNPHDVASLFKQFLRELPLLLLPAHYLGLLEACVTLVPIKEQEACLHLSCLLLPSSHLQCLCVVMRLLGKVAKGSGHSLMDANNLAVVMAPNLMETKTENFDFRDNPLKVQTSIAKTLIGSDSELGVVPYEVGVASEKLKQGLSSALTRSLETMLEDNDGDDPLPNRYRTKKLRTYSLSDLMSGWGNKLKRQKGGACSPDDVGQPETAPKRAIKRGQHPLTAESDSKRPALDCSLNEFVSRGTMHTPLLQDNNNSRKKKRHQHHHHHHVHHQDRSSRTTTATTTTRFNIGSLKHFRPARPPPGEKCCVDDGDDGLVSISNPAITSGDGSFINDDTPPSHAQHMSDVLTTTTSADTLPGCGPMATNFELLTSPNVGSPGTRKLFSMQNSPLPGDKDPPLPGDKTPLGSECCMTFSFSSPSTKPTHQLTGRMWAEPKKPYMFSSPTPYASHVTVSSPRLVVGHVTNPSHDFSYPNVLSPPLQPNLLDEVRAEMTQPLPMPSNSMAIYKASSSSSSSSVAMDTYEVKGQGTSNQDLSMKRGDVYNPASSPHYSARKVKGQGTSRGQSSACYSATLGINTSDLPRRKLRDYKVLSCDDHVTRSRGCRGDSLLGLGAANSPTIMSAALGITHIEKSSRIEKKVGDARNKKYYSPYSSKENVMPLLMSHDYATTPPLIKILESNVNSKTVDLLSLDDHVVPSSTNHALSLPTKHNYSRRPLNQMNSEPHHVESRIAQAPPTTKAPPTHRFRSPFLRSSSRKCCDYTPVKDKGSISKRAQAYMVKTPHPTLQNHAPLKRIAKRTNLLKELSNDIDVTEWLL